ncbi:MAG: bifunctional aspartate transaminase/aspartate 4-decarboxylase [Geminicoccaceae bacterium]
MDVVTLRKYETLSPFEIKDELIKLAKKTSQKSAMAFLNAGRGNPNWIATRGREAFFLFGQFAVEEAKRVMDHPAGVAGMPQARGIARRLDAWLATHANMAGADTLKQIVPYAIQRFGFEPDAFVHELADSIIGDNYPVPDRMLVHNERITHEYLNWAMCGSDPNIGKFDLYAVEGGTAAMCYIFKSLKANRLLNAGDTIALGTPIFTPYLEMPHLEDYALNVVFVNAEREDGFQFTEEDFKQLEDPKVKAFFLVNPGNPTAVALSQETRARLVELVRTKRPDLIILTDDVYGTFVNGFRSLMADLPHNTIGVYSYSKYFGCTGWRLGVIAVHQKNILDEMIAKHDEEVLKKLDKRYGPITLKPRELKFIDRIVADSRDIALNHTAGLSLPQQVMMSVFSLVELVDTEKAYQKACMEIVKRRVDALLEGVGTQVQLGPLFDNYYGLLDFEYWLRKNVSEEVVQYVKKNIHPLDIVFKLAEDHGIVLLNGGGFHAPNWSARVSFANLDDDVYDDIGRAVRSIARGYIQAYEASIAAKGGK